MVKTRRKDYNQETCTEKQKTDLQYDIVIKQTEVNNIQIINDTETNLIEHPVNDQKKNIVQTLKTISESVLNASVFSNIFNDSNLLITTNLKENDSNIINMKTKTAKRKKSNACSKGVLNKSKQKYKKKCVTSTPINKLFTTRLSYGKKGRVLLNSTGESKSVIDLVQNTIKLSKDYSGSLNNNTVKNNSRTQIQKVLESEKSNSVILIESDTENEVTIDDEDISIVSWTKKKEDIASDVDVILIDSYSVNENRNTGTEFGKNICNNVESLSRKQSDIEVIDQTIVINDSDTTLTSRRSNRLKRKVSKCTQVTPKNTTSENSVLINNNEAQHSSNFAATIKLPNLVQTALGCHLSIPSNVERCNQLNLFGVSGNNVYNPNQIPKQGLRLIVIDGSNVAMGHSQGYYFSTRGLQICIDYFLKRGHSVKAFVPHFRLKRNKSTLPHILEELGRKGYVVFTPTREVNGRMIIPYDDRYIVQCATEFGGVIVSNDNFRDLMSENKAWKETIEKRLLMWTWVGDTIMFPVDPLGRDGPTLDRFLRFP